MTKRTFSDVLNVLSNSFVTRKGMFLSAGHDGRENTMTISWGSVGVYWGKPTFVAPVRHSRFTLPLIEKSGAFTVSIPTAEQENALAYVGANSGRDGDKWAAAGITPIPALSVPAPVVKGASLYIECRLVLTLDMAASAQFQAPENAARWYADGNPHKMLYGEIVDIWSE